MRVSDAARTFDEFYGRVVNHVSEQFLLCVKRQEEKRKINLIEETNCGHAGTYTQQSFADITLP